MAYTMWTKKYLVGIALVAACGLLGGCSPATGGAGAGGRGPDGSSEGQQKSDSLTSADDGDGATPDRPNTGGASGDGEASCLVGTWKEDLSVLTKEMIKKIGGDAPIKWSGGAFLRFDDKGGFYNWTEDSVFESWWGDDYSRSVTNGAVVGDYDVKNSVIHWSDLSTLFNDTVLDSNGVGTEGESADLADNYRHPAPFSCSTDKLVAHLGTSDFTIPRVFYRTTAPAPTTE